MKQHIYLYTIPIELVRTEAETGQFVNVKGKRALAALPTSVAVAEAYGYSSEEIKLFAPQLSWFIPQYVLYGKVKLTEDLISSLDGWRALLTPQQNEMMHSKVMKHAPHIVTSQISQMLLPEWTEPE